MDQGFGWKILRERFHGYFSRIVGVSDGILKGNNEEISSLRSWSEITSFSDGPARHFLYRKAPDFA